MWNIIDTCTVPMNLRLSVTGGQIIECPNCGKRYSTPFLDGRCGGVGENAGNPNRTD